MRLLVMRFPSMKMHLRSHLYMCRSYGDILIEVAQRAEHCLADGTSERH